MIEHHECIRGDRNAVATEYGHTDFDYEQVFADLDGHLKQERKELEFHRLAENFRRNLQWVFFTDGIKKRRMKIAFRRFVALTAALHPEIFENESYAEIGRQIGATKALLSWMTMRLQRKYGVQFARSRSEVGREHMRASAKRSWQKRR